MTKIQGRHGQTGFDQDLVPHLAAREITVIPGPAMQINDDWKRAHALGPEQAHHQGPILMAKVFQILGGKFLRTVQHEVSPKQ